jgi:hypothetical protein
MPGIPIARQRWVARLGGPVSPGKTVVAAGQVVVRAAFFRLPDIAQA